MKLSEEQKKAVLHGTGPMMVLAGPGAGKTTVITRRVKKLIEEDGVNPAQILVVTFSKAASVEMRERFEAITGGRQLPVRFGTFHSLFFQILKAAYHYSVKDIVTPKLKYRFMEEALLETEYDDIEDRKEFLEEIEKEISRVKGDGTDIRHYYSANCPEEIFRQIYQGYQSRVQKNHCLDFDDMVMYTYELFRARPDILAGWQKRFTYILIDEFQDINRLQYENIKMLARPENNLFIVGDDDQSIYGFRGARPDIMLAFPREYKNLPQVTVGNNYRCTSQILKAASMLIGYNKKRYKKHLTACKGSGDLVHVAEYPEPVSQAEAILSKIQEYHKQGISFDETAVLFRTARQMTLLSRKFMEYNIPFVMKDRVQNLFEHWVAKDILTYIEMAHGDRSRRAFLKIANRPKRYLSRSAFYGETISFGELYEYYRDKPYMCERINTLQNDLHALRQMTPYSAVDYIYNGIGYHTFLREYGAERNVNIKEWEDVVEELKEDAAEYPTVQAWFAHIEEYAKKLEEKEKRGQEEKREPGVALMTMHGAKGLEFDAVFIPDVNEGIVPYHKSIEDGGLEEERRLLYVAMTRAREHLHLSYTKQRFHKEAEPSRFLGEISPRQH
ncbi:MAG: ATP-dependent helicase [Roseburia sp.]|nr:ATP-dependent helicase [Roseburia sp.]